MWTTGQWGRLGGSVSDVSAFSSGRVPVGFTVEFRESCGARSQGIKGIKVLLRGRKGRLSPRTAVHPRNASKKGKEREGTWFRPAAFPPLASGQARTLGRMRLE